MISIRKFATVSAAMVSVSTCFTPSVFAQAAPATQSAAQAAAPAGGFTLKAKKQTFRANGVKLEGEARITSPQLDVAADVISFDFTTSQIQKVNARGNVRLKISLTPQGGGAATRIEANCSFATLDPITRTLVLDGGVKGFYTLADGKPNTISGNRATLKYDEAKNLLADIEGGTGLNQMVSFVLPAENPNLPTAIGSVVVTARRANINTATGQVNISGNARAVSNDGPNKFDVSAPAFVISRSAGGGMDTLKTTGRTTLKLDLPPEAAPTAAQAANATPAKGSASNVGKPTRLEVAADGATVQRADNTLVFEGNVSGFYELSQAGAQPTRQNFSGDRAVVKYILPAQASAENPSGVQLEMTGKPVTIDAPLNFTF